ncbi:MAG: maltose acetyltransferase domain-containing protein, partial [Longicatena sp.]
MDKTQFSLSEIKARMHTKKLYYSDDPVLLEEQMKRLDKLFAYNSLPPSKFEEKQALLKEMFKQIGSDCYIETPFHANWGGKFVTMGNGVYANFNLTLVDD